MGSKKQGRSYQHRNVPHQNPIRVRGKRLEEIDETKLALAYWLLARKIAEDRTDPAELSEPKVRRLAEELERNGKDAPEASDA